MRVLEYVKTRLNDNVRQATLDNAERAASCLLILNAVDSKSSVTVAQVHELFENRGYDISRDRLYRVLKEMPGFAPNYGPRGLTYHYERNTMLQFVNGPGDNYPQNLALLRVLAPTHVTELTPLQAEVTEIYKEGLSTLTAHGWDKTKTLTVGDLHSGVGIKELKSIVAASLILLGVEG